MCLQNILTLKTGHIGFSSAILTFTDLLKGFSQNTSNPVPSNPKASLFFLLLLKQFHNLSSILPFSASFYESVDETAINQDWASTSKHQG